MSDNVLRLDMSAEDYIGILNKVVAEWRKYGEIVARSTEVSVKAGKVMKDGNKTADEILRTLKATTDQNKQLLITQKWTADGWEDVALKVREASAAMEAQARIAAKVAKATPKPRNTSTHGLAAYEVTNKKSIDPTSVGATEAEALKQSQAVAKLTGLIYSQKVQIQEINKIWGELSRGEIVQYDARLAKVQRAVAAVMTAQRGLGAEAAKTAQALEAQRIAAEKTSLKEAQAAQTAVIAARRAQRAKLDSIGVNADVAKSEAMVAASYAKGLKSPDYQSAIAKEKQAYAQRANELSKFVKDNQIASTTLNSVWKNVDSGQLQAYGGKLGQLQTKIVAFQNAQKNLGNSFRDWQQRVNEANKSTQSFLLSWKSIARLATIQILHRGISAFIQGLSNATKEAVQLGNAIAEIQTISQDSRRTTTQWYEDAKQLAVLFGTDVATQLEAAYQTISNQVAKGASVTTFLVDANKLATSAVSSTADAVNILSSVINAYGDSAENADIIGAKLFKGVELGRFRLSQIANSFGDVSVIAQQTGVSLDELSAAMATLTRQGIAPAKAMTQLRGILDKVLSPTKDMNRFIAGTGYESGQALIQAEGFVGFLERVQKSTDGSASELRKLINRIRGFSGALVLSGEGLEQFKKDLQAVEKASASYGDAIDITLNSSAKRAQQAIQVIKNEFRDFGKNAIDNFALFLDAFFDFSDKLDRERERLEAPLIASRAVTRSKEIFIKSIDDQIRATRRLEAEQIVSAGHAYEKNRDYYKKLSEDVVVYNKTIIESLKSTTSGLSSSIKKLTDDLKKNRESAADSLQLEKELAFDWAQETRDELAKIQALKERIMVIDHERKNQVKAGNLELVQEANKKIIEYIKEIQKLQSEAEKGNAKNAEKRAEIEQKIADIRDKSEQRAIASNKKAIEKSKGTRKTPSLAGPILTVDEQQQLRDLYNEYSRIKDVTVETLKARTLLAAEIQQELRNNQQLDKVLSDQKAEEEKRLALRKIQTSKLEQLNTTFNKFDLEKVKGMKTREGLLAIEQQIDTIDQMIALTDKLGLKRTEVFSTKPLALLKAELAYAVDELQTQNSIRDAADARVKALEEIKRVEEENVSKQAEQAANTQEIINKYEELKVVLSDYAKEASKINDVDDPFYAKRIQRFERALDSLNRKGLAKTTNDLFLGSFWTDSLSDTATKLKTLSYDLQRLLINRDAYRRTEEQVKATLESNEKIIQESNITTEAMKIRTEELKKRNDEYNQSLRTTSDILGDIMSKLGNMSSLPQPSAPIAELQTNARGSVMRGSDSIMSLLRPDEAVMNANATRRFYSQLVAMNATPQSMQAPGLSIGNVSINMQASGRLSYDAISLGRELKKLSARKVI